MSYITLIDLHNKTIQKNRELFLKLQISLNREPKKLHRFQSFDKYEVRIESRQKYDLTSQSSQSAKSFVKKEKLLAKENLILPSLPTTNCIIKNKKVANK